MDLAQHCALCDNQLLSLKAGTTCALTNRKPEFNKTCPKIALSEKFETRIKKVHIALENVRRTKIDTYTHVILFLSISIAVIYGGYYLGKYAWDAGVLSTVPLLIICAGLATLVFAMGPLNKYKNELSIAKSKMATLQQVLNLYHIDYDIALKYDKPIHGIPQVTADLNIKRKP